MELLWEMFLLTKCDVFLCLLFALTFKVSFLSLRIKQMFEPQSLRISSSFSYFFFLEMKPKEGIDSDRG